MLIFEQKSIFFYKSSFFVCSYVKIDGKQKAIAQKCFDSCKQTLIFSQKIACPLGFFMISVPGYRQGTSKDFTYLVFGFHQSTPERVRLRSKIFPSQGTMTVHMNERTV